MTAVKYQLVATPDDGIRLDRWFKRHYPLISHGTIEKALRKGEIRVNGQKIKANYRLQVNDEIRVPPLKQASGKNIKKTKKIDDSFIESLKSSVIEETDDWIALNKPAGIAVQGGSKVKECVDDALPYLGKKSDQLKLVHRLDKDTSGILIIAKSVISAAKLTKQFKTKAIQKLYIAITSGVPQKKHGTISDPLLKTKKDSKKEKMHVDHKGKKAITHYQVLDTLGNKSALVLLEPVTGRTHQLRVHMANIGTPILGDGKYGGKKAFIDGVSEKLHLHAFQIVLEKKKLEASLPTHIKKTCECFDFRHK